MAMQRFRLRFTFWLNINKSEERDLAEQIDDLKRKRSFAKTIRDGIRLMVDLYAGQTDVLFELFPWIKEKLHTVSAPDGAAGLSEEKLRAIIREATAGQAVSHDKQEIAHVPMLPKPLVLDDELPKATVVKTAQASGKSGEQNFLNSISALMNG
jgi:hypothetical protein